MISQKMKYALKALLVLADERAGEGHALRIEEIARRSGAPKRFLEQILLEMRNAGLLASIRGRAGGYRLDRDPEAVALVDVLRLIDGPMAPLPCLSRRYYARCADCGDEAACRIRRAFAEAFGAYLAGLESMTLAGLAASPDDAGRIVAT